MSSAEKEFRRSIPDRDDDLRESDQRNLQELHLETDLVRCVERLQWLLIQPRESEITNLDLSGRSDEDVGGFEIAMNNPIVVEIGDSVEQLPEQRFEHWNRESSPCRRVMMNDLLCGGCIVRREGIFEKKGKAYQEIVLGVFEDEVD